ncbi:MAG: hypothetical protein WC767_03235 [Candidatus Paceibacterota bacterium]|jgi:hypothetical protein
MKKEILLIYPESREINRLKIEGRLDENGQPVRMTHYATCEMNDGRGNVIHIYENVFKSTLEASGEKVVIFDRQGNAFEVMPEDLHEMGATSEPYAV